MFNKNSKLAILLALLCALSIPVALVLGNSADNNTNNTASSVAMPTDGMPVQYYSPTIELETSYISDTLQAGQTYVYKVQVKNIGVKDITIDPKLNSNYPIIYPMTAGASSGNGGATVSTNTKVASIATSVDTTNSSTEPVAIATPMPVSASIIPVNNNGKLLSSGDINVSAPSTIKVNDTVDMYITVAVPDDVIGSYYSSIDMNVNNEENNMYNPQLSLNFMIQAKVDTPFAKTFILTNNAPITIEVSTDTYSADQRTRVSPPIENPTFDVVLMYNGTPINLNMVKLTDSGNAGLGMYYPAWTEHSGNVYQNYGDHYAETYQVQGKKGSYRLTIMPKNANNFGYSITIGNDTTDITSATPNNNIVATSTELGNSK